MDGQSDFDAKHLNNWVVFQGLWDDILEGKVDSENWGQIIPLQTQKQSFNSFSLVVLMHTDNWSSSLQCIHTML